MHGYLLQKLNPQINPDSNKKKNPIVASSRFLLREFSSMLTCKGCIRGDQSGFESPQVYARILPALSVLIVFCLEQKGEN